MVEGGREWEGNVVQGDRGREVRGREWAGGDSRIYLYPSFLTG